MFVFGGFGFGLIEVPIAKERFTPGSGWQPCAGCGVRWDSRLWLRGFCKLVCGSRCVKLQVRFFLKRRNNNAAMCIASGGTRSV
jgi:hypothetical protein